MEKRQVIIMGVSGSGKSLIGKKLAEALAIRFIEGDDLHPSQNVQKMSAGIPLSHTDRLPWLLKIRDILQDFISKEEPVVISCSALKKNYRDTLRTAGKVTFIFLDVPESVLKERMKHRQGHFMPLSLLNDQLSTLEKPTDAEEDTITIDASKTPEQVIKTCLQVIDQ